MFFYKKQPNGNYTFGGVAKELMDDAKEYFNMRSENRKNLNEYFEYISIILQCQIFYS